MRIHIATDYYGVAGQVEPTVTERTREQLTNEVAAAVNGINNALNETPVITVGEKHSAQLQHRRLDENVSLINGRNLPYAELTGGEEADMAMFIGAHGGMGGGGVLEHTFDPSKIQGVSLDNRPQTEVELNALLLETWDTPLVFLSGDAVACEEAEGAVDGINTVTTKSARGAQAATSYHPNLVTSDINSAVQQAVQETSVGYSTMPVSPPYEAAATLTSQELADKAVMWPAVERTDSTTVSYAAETTVEAYQFFCALQQL